MHAPTWEGDLYPLRPESPHCPGGSAPPTPPMACPVGEGPLLSDWQGGGKRVAPALALALLVGAPIDCAARREGGTPGSKSVQPLP